MMLLFKLFFFLLEEIVGTSSVFEKLQSFFFSLEDNGR